MSASEIPLTVSALVERVGAMLLVQEQGLEDASPSWMLPGGRVEMGETAEAAVRRELKEETGLVLLGPPRLAFEVEIEAALEDLAGRWRAVTYACDVDGMLAPNDPDGLVLAAEWVDRPRAFERLEAVEWYDTAPLRAFLSGSSRPGARYRYGLSGRRGAVTRSVVEIVDAGSHP